MKAVKVLGLAFLFLCFSMTMAQAKDVKIGYVDLKRAFYNYQKTKDFDAILQKEREAFQKEIEEKVSKVRDMQGKMALLKEEEKAKMQTDIEKLRGDVIAFDKQKKAELVKNHDEKMREILLEIEKIVSELAKKEGYDFILNDQMLIYGDQAQNLTEKVLKVLNSNRPEKK